MKASAPNGQILDGGSPGLGQIGANFEIVFLAINLSILVEFYFSKCQMIALNEIYQKTPFLG